MVVFLTFEIVFKVSMDEVMEVFIGHFFLTDFSTYLFSYFFYGFIYDGIKGVVNIKSVIFSHGSFIKFVDIFQVFGG